MNSNPCLTLSYCNSNRTHNHLIRKQTHNHLVIRNTVFICELIGSDHRCSHLNFRSRVCSEQGVPWRSDNYGLKIHSINVCHCVKSVHIRSFSGLHFHACGLNTEIYSVNLRIQAECGNMQSRKIPNRDWRLTMIRIMIMIIYTL